MLAVTIDFEIGAFRADPSGSASTGSARRCEWPPVPMRQYSAFVAAMRGDDPTGALHCMVGLPVIHADPRPASDDDLHARIPPKFVSEATSSGYQTKFVSKGKSRMMDHAGMIGKKGKLIHPGCAIAAKQVVFEYRDAEVTDAQFDALQSAARKIPYIGCSDSPAVVSVSRAMPGDLPGRAFVPDPDGSLVLRVPKPDALAILVGKHERGEQASEGVRHWNHAGYRLPGESSAGCRCVILSLDAAVPAERMTLLTRAFKSSLIASYGRCHAGPVPPCLHGHASAGCKAAYLALPERYGIKRIAVLLPDGLDQDVMRNITNAAWRMRRIEWDKPAFAVGVDPLPDAASIRRRWMQPSRSWATVTPLIHESNEVRGGRCRSKLKLDKASGDYVRRMCRNAGLPEPVEWKFEIRPMVPDGLHLRIPHVLRPDRMDEKIDYSHAAFVFAEPVDGPVVLGRGRNRGLGLCLPTDRQKG